jgi:large subunit ribosomal protein L21
MYAIIRVGGKQAKVQNGDVIEIERLKDTGDTVSFTPLMVVDDKGKTISDRKELEKALVTAEVLGETKGDKVQIFKYKNKSGYRRRAGHRQIHTQVRVTEIKLPAAKKAARKTQAAESEAATEEE